MSKEIKSICVYCGSRSGVSEDYGQLAESVGAEIAARSMSMVYGAASIGLMGITAQAALKGGADVIGVIPGHLDAVEITAPNLTELHITKNMHDRKLMMFNRSDAFIILPGGLGSLDEMMEILTWAQLSVHSKPVVILNHRGFWDKVLDLFDHIVSEGFADARIRSLFFIAESIGDAFDYLEKQTAAESGRIEDIL